MTSAVLGIGMNVLAKPEVPPTSFVPRVTSLGHACGRADDALLPEVLWHLLDTLSTNYQDMLENGVRPLFEKYRSRSIVLGREVAIYEDIPEGVGRQLARGKVSDMTERLELVLEGQGTISSGRLVLTTQ